MQLSIITCTYNSEIYLQECINSVISQNLHPEEFEHIFIDGFSTDKTLEIIKKYQRRCPQYHIDIIQSKPKGVYNAMNIGIRNAKGKYILFVNSDDYLEENVLGAYLQRTQTQADIYYADLNEVRGEGKKATNHFHHIKKILWYLFGFNVLVFHPTTLIKRALFTELGGYDETKRIASDYGFFLLCLIKKKKFEYYNSIVTNFRVWENSLSSNGRSNKVAVNEVKWFRRKYLGKLLGNIINFLSALLKNRI